MVLVAQRRRRASGSDGLVVASGNVVHNLGRTAVVRRASWSTATLGSISMTSYALDCECGPTENEQAPVADPLPEPTVVPPDQTNI